MKTIIRLTILLFIYIVTSSTAQTTNFEWAKKIVGGEDLFTDYGKSVGTDSFGNVYTAGIFHGRYDFNPSLSIADTFFLSTALDTTSYYELRMFVTKVDAAGNFVWAKQFETPATRRIISSMVVDQNGYIYITGEFVSAFDFDPGVSEYILHPMTIDSLSGLSPFVCKLDPAGNFVWAKALKGIQKTIPFFSQSDGRSTSINLDASNNILVTGNFYGTIDFNPSDGLIDTFNLTSKNQLQFVGLWSTDSIYYYDQPSPYVRNDTIFQNQWGTDIFILKLSNDGSFVWAKQVGCGFSAVECAISGNILDYPINDNSGFSIDADSYGNVYVTGSYKGTADFNPDTTAIYNLTAALTNEASMDHPAPDIFILKLTSAGSFEWVKGIGGGYPDFGTEVMVDNLDNLIIVGGFRDTVDFDPGTSVYNLISNATSKLFLLKLNSGGNFIWAKQDNLAEGYQGIETLKLPYTLGKNNHIYCTHDANEVYPSHEGRSYIRELDADANFVWEGEIGNPLNRDNTFSICAGVFGNIYVTGGFHSTGDFDPTFATDSLVNPNTYSDPFYGANIFTLKLCQSSLSLPSISKHGDSLIASAAATYEWYKDGVLIPGANTQYYYAADTNGSYTVCSTAHGETCNACSAPFSFATGINEHRLVNTIAIYPNPNNGQFEIALQLNTQDNYMLELTNALGQVLYHEELKNFIGTYHKQLDETKYGAGIYLFRVKNSKEQSVKKVISW